LFLAALLWPDQSRSVATRGQRSHPIATPIEARELPPINERVNSLNSPSESNVPIAVELGTATSVEQQRNSLPRPSSTSNNATVESISKQLSDASLTPNEQRTLKETGIDDTSLRNSDFPRTYISKIHVDLTSPNHWVTLTWTGPNARLQPTTQYHSSPGRGLGYNNCDDPAESCRVNSNCTPKGTMHVEAFSHTMVTSPECRYVTWFDTKRGIALHYYPFVPNYPASHGCVRLNEYAAHLIHNNSKIGETEVVIDGKWTFAR
jgi:hypothetical protein